MSADRRLSPQAMTAQDRQFDALLRRAEQRFQEVTVEQPKILKKASMMARQIANRMFAAHVAKG